MDGKALFLDRDGVVNVDGGYVHRIEDFQLVPGILELCRRAKEKGYLVIVVTNQSGIGRGMFTEEDFFVKKDEEYKNQIKWIIPNAQKNCMEPIHLILEKGGETCLDNPHEGEEFGYVLKGKVEIHLGKRSYIAKKGDAFYYKADKTHYLKGIEQTELIWVTSPPSF